MTGRDAMISGQRYQDDPELREQRRRCARLLERVPPGTLVAVNPARVIRTL